MAMGSHSQRRESDDEKLLQDNLTGRWFVRSTGYFAAKEMLLQPHALPPRSPLARLIPLFLLDVRELRAPVASSFQLYPPGHSISRSNF